VLWTENRALRAPLLSHICPFPLLSVHTFPNNFFQSPVTVPFKRFTYSEALFQLMFALVFKLNYSFFRKKSKPGLVDFLAWTIFSM
jgi:hypothetical protein